MIVDEKTVKRYAIYVFYDKDGKADEYNFYLLKELRKVISKLLVVVNGKADAEAERRFREIADDFYIRPNEGFDITAYKEGLFYYGYDGLKEYEEVIVLNSTCYGPFYPFSEMFGTMDKRDLDFWGVTTFHQTTFDPFGTIKYGYIPKHIQSYFMVFRKSFVSTSDFRTYWENLPVIHNYFEAVGFHETVFTKDFADKGYQWSAYIDPENMDRTTFEPLRDFPRYCIETLHCPFMKRRSFFHDYGEAVGRSGGEATKEAFDYIRRHTDYDVNMIWDNLLRLQNLADLKKRLSLNFILSSKFAEEKNTVMKTALFLYVYYPEKAADCFDYVKNVPPAMDIYIAFPYEKDREHFKNVFKCLEENHRVEYRVTGNRGRDIGPFLIGMRDVFMDYDLVLKVHDKKVKQIEPMSIGLSWEHKCFENLMKNTVFMQNVISAFEENPRLGLLMPPIPLHGPYYPTIGKNEWGDNFEVTRQLAEELKLHVDLNQDKEPIAPLGGMFWFRPKALLDLYNRNFSAEDFPEEPIPDDATVLHAIERLYPFCAQNRGYYSGWLMADSYAPVEFDNWKFLNQNLEAAIAEKIGWKDRRSLLLEFSDRG